MNKRLYLADRELCPFLPPAPEAVGPRFSKERRGEDGYFLSTLICAQSLWLQALPAQALLQINHALSIPERSTQDWQWPYQAILWIISRRHADGFMGNPVRHFQHLASRMSGPNKELRCWRAWACFHLAQSILPVDEFPHDQRQIEKENLHIPQWDETLDQLSLMTSDDEVQLLRGLL